MSVEKVLFEVRGIAPLLMHNGQLSDPLNNWTKQIAELTARGKGKKSDATHEEIGRLEWFGGTYTDENEKLILPDFVVEAAIVGGAKRSRLGTTFKSGIFVLDHAILDIGKRYSSLNELYQDPNYRSRVPAKVGTSKVCRTRPIFRSWQTSFTVSYDTDQVNFAQLLRAVKDTGAYVGFGDWRPRHGRFEVVSHSKA